MHPSELVKLAVFTLEPFLDLCVLKYYRVFTNEGRVAYFSVMPSRAEKVLGVLMDPSHLSHDGFPPSWFVLYEPASLVPLVATMYSGDSVASLSLLSDASGQFSPAPSTVPVGASPSQVEPASTEPAAAAPAAAVGPLAQAAQDGVAADGADDGAAAAAVLLGLGVSTAVLSAASGAGGDTAGVSTRKLPAASVETGAERAIRDHHACFAFRRALSDAASRAIAAGEDSNLRWLYAECVEIHAAVDNLKKCGVEWGQLQLPSRQMLPPCAPCVRNPLCTRGWRHSGGCSFHSNGRVPALEAFTSGALIFDDGPVPNEGSSAMHAAYPSKRARHT